MQDHYNLQRFVDAQSEHPDYNSALLELRSGRKSGHWMWYIFPQIAGLGFSDLSRFYALSSVEEARAYLAHPVLGPRIRECAQVAANLDGVTAIDIFGSIDAMKLRSSMTLFDQAGSSGKMFADVIKKYFDGNPDPATLERLEQLDR